MVELAKKLFETEKVYPQYNPTPDEAFKVSFVDTRFTAMKQSRSLVDKDRQTYQDMIDAIYMEYPDGRSSSVVPLASSIIELFVAEAIKIPTEFKFRGETSKYATNARALEYVRKYDRRKNNRKKAFNENEYICAAFGTSVLYTGFEAYEKNQMDFAVADDMSVTREKKTFKKEEIIVRNINLGDFYIDNQAISGIDDAADCILRQWMGYEKFKNFENSPLYKNIEYVVPKQYSNENKPTTTMEDNSKQGEFVELKHYWNVEKDMYVVIANGILVREHPMLSTINGEKALPFVVRNLGKKNYSIYGRGLCEALMMFNSEINNLREMCMDGIRRSNMPTIAIGNGLQFDGRQFSFDNEILTFDGNFADNFQQISGQPPNQAIFNYLIQLYKDVAVFVGIDIQNIIGEPQQTAFQTEVQREASQKRVNVWLTNKDLAYERFADLHKDNLQIYFPRKTAEGVYPIIEIEDEALIGEGEKQGFKKKKGKSQFEVKPEMLRGDIFVDVFTNVNNTSINAVDKQGKLDLMNSVGQMINGYAIAKQAGIDIESILPIKDNLRAIAEDYNLAPKDKDDNTEVEAAKKQFFNDLQSMMPQPGLTPPPEATQQPQQQSPQQQPQPKVALANNPGIGQSMGG